MADNDPLSNALSGMDNAESVGYLSHEIQSASNIIGSVLEVFHDRRHTDDFEFVGDGKADPFEVELKGAINDCGVVKPWYSAGADDFERWEKRLLLARDHGALIVTMSHGVMNHYETREKDIGGQIIAYVH